ncbi:MAG: FHA domain-containing protein [Mycolicibacterium insubricum]|nr:FHA domain-containing protein [Mycobacterium sp.]
MEPERRPWLAVRSGAEWHHLDPDGPLVAVGRDPASQIWLGYDFVSRTHLELSFDDGDWVATDRSSKGIFVNGARRGVVVITDGLVIALAHPDGPVLQFELVSGPPAPAPLPPMPPRELTEPVAMPISELGQLLRLALSSIDGRIATLPSPNNPEFSAAAAPVLGDLRALLSVAASATKTTSNAPDLLVAVADAWRRYDKLLAGSG